MGSYHDEELRRQIRSSLAPLSPDESARQRMYDAILEQNARGRKRPKPWYLRWQMSVGVGMAAMACVLVMIFTAHDRLPQNGSEQLHVVPPAAEIVTTAREQTTETPPSTATTAAVSTSAQADETTGASVTQTEISQTATSAEDVQPEVVVPPENSRPISPEPWTTTSASTQTAPASTTAAVTQTLAPETQSATQPTQTSPRVTMPTATESAPDQEATPPTETQPVEDDSPPIRQNLYLYNMLTWNEIRYQTTYETVDTLDLIYLGAGATDGKDVSDTYTVLVYAIAGVDPTQQLAVQYAGETNYYRFTPT